MKKKAIRFLLLILILLTAPLTACNSSPSAGEPGGEAPTIISVWYSLQGKEEQELLRQFELIGKNYHEVKVKGTKVSANELVDRVWNLQAGGQGPEIVIAERALIFALYEKGAISPVLAESSDIYPAPLAVFTFNQQPFALPFITDVPLLYYRTDRIKSPPKSLSEILQKDSVAVKSLETGLLSPWFKAEGGVFEKEGVPVLNSSANAAYINKILNLKSENKLITGDQALQAFITGETDYLISWASDSVSLDNAKVDWGCVSLSSLSGSNAGAILNNTVGIANSSIKTVPLMENAIRLVEEELLKAGDLMHKTSGYLPTTWSWYENSQAGTWKAETALTLEKAQPLSGYALDWKLISFQDQAIKNIFSGSKVEDELSLVQKAALEMLKKEE